MIKKEKAKKIKELLDLYIPDTPIPLTHKDPYTLLIAVVLSARSTDKKVNEITPKLFSLADTPEKMIEIPYEELRAIIKPCGLSPSKARGILGLSKIILEEHNGKVPTTLQALEKLPAVGHKTASVVVCQAFNTPAFPVDTHIYRLAKRWGLSTGKSVKKVEEDLKKLFLKKDWIKLHLQIIYYARKYCPSRGHKVETCPICTYLKTVSA